MPLTCIAIDDEPLALALVKDYAGRSADLQLLQTFEDAIAGNEYLLQHPVDLLFIDINMPDITGLDLVRGLKNKPMVIFTTAHAKFAIDGFDLDAVDYLLKPISIDRFNKSIQKAKEYFAYKTRPQSVEADSLFVYSEYRMIRIPFADIEYIESLEDYIRIHLLNGKPVMTLLTMKKVLEKLPATQFRRIHRSYIVATAQVRSVLSRKVMLGSGTELPVSDSYLDFLTDWKKA
jgi:two-component system, LytTR family, response regulator